ncbi:MAG: CocE/NonD family hydrolase [Candidatus Dormibacteria bacterium]
MTCAARDGTRLATDLYRPDDEARHPGLLVRTPYSKTNTGAPILDPIRFAEAGYMVAIQDVRGRFASEGDYAPYATEAEDGYDAVQWLASHPSCDGRVGMYGVSYLAQVQFMAAAMQPPALRAIAPFESPAGSTGADRVRSGALALGLLAYWSLALMPAELLRRARSDPSLYGQLAEVVEDLDTLDQELLKLPLLPFRPMSRFAPSTAVDLFEETVRGEYNSPVPRFDHSAIAVPAMVIAGWNDLFLQPDLDHFTALRRQAATEDARRLTRLIVGPWSHGVPTGGTVGERGFGMRASPVFLDLKEDATDLHLRWFDARLRGIDSGIDAEPPVRIFVMGLNRWRNEEQWPPEGSVSTEWYLGAAATLSRQVPTAAAESTFRLDPDNPVRTRGGSLLMAESYLRGPVDQLRTEQHPDVLLFTSEPLAGNLLVVGRVLLRAWIVAETVDTDVVARLCEVDEAGRSINVCDGILRLQYRDGMGHPAPLVPGRPTEVEVDLWSTAYQFKAGRRLRLQVCASDFPRYDRNPGTGQLSAIATRVVPQVNRILTGPDHPSRLLLPLLPE